MWPHTAPRRFSPVEVKPLMERPRPLPKTVCSLLADHQNCKRTWHRCALGPATPARRWWRRRPTLLAHRQDVVSLAVERDRSGAIHRLKILLDLETRRTLLLDDGQRAVAVRAEGFLRRRVENGAVRPTGERQTYEDLAVLGAQDHHHRLCRLGGRISRVPTRREQHMILRVQSQPVAPALVPEGVVRDSLHRLDIDGRDAALRVLHDNVEHAFAVADALLWHAAQIDLAEHGAVQSRASATAKACSTLSC